MCASPHLAYFVAGTLSMMPPRPSHVVPSDLASPASATLTHAASLQAECLISALGEPAGHGMSAGAGVQDAGATRDELRLLALCATVMRTGNSNSGMR